MIWEIRVYCSRPWEHERGGRESIERERERERETETERETEKMHDCGARKIDDLNNILGR